jgi:protein-S-isoprenylcysteine O-methyltransferase Ste14
MFELISIVNAVVCLSMFFVCVFAILHPSVNDGIVIKCGLILLTVGFGTVAYKLSGMCDLYDIQSLERALLLVHIGAIVLVFGYVLRVIKAGHNLQRWSDWLGQSRGQEIKWPQVTGSHDGS